MEAVKFSQTPSCMIFTLVARKLAGPGGPGPAVREPVELPDPGTALPPERPDHPGREQPAPLGVKVGLEAVGDHRVIPDDRLLPAGDAQRMQVALGLADAGH